MAKVIDKNDVNKILKINADNIKQFYQELFDLYPEGINMSMLNNIEKHKLKVKEWSYSICGDIKYNDPNLLCKRCNSKKVAKITHGDVFMRRYNGNKNQKTKEIEKFKNMGLFINSSSIKTENSKEYVCLECGNEW